MKSLTIRTDINTRRDALLAVEDVKSKAFSNLLRSYVGARVVDAELSFDNTTAIITVYVNIHPSSFASDEQIIECMCELANLTNTIKSVSKHGVQYETTGSAGADIAASLDEPLTIEPHQTVMIATGLYPNLLKGYELQVRSRSSMALKGMIVTNSPGTIDSDYSGEIKVMLTNTSPSPVIIENGDRVAQLVLAKYERLSNVPISEMIRGSGGFGSTGK